MSNSGVTSQLQAAVAGRYVVVRQLGEGTPMARGAIP